MVLHEFDPAPEAVINPWEVMKRVEKAGNLPDDRLKLAVTCFEGKTIDRMVELLKPRKLAVLRNANGETPVYHAQYKGKDFVLYLSDMGAPGAGGDLEEIFALGVEKVVMFGSCGVLEESIQDGAIIIPNAAVRDEGLSYHYAPPSDEIQVNLKYIPEFKALLEEVNCPYYIGKTWTTDAFYRETPKKVESRKAQGCICVEMECSAMAAVAQFRGKELFQFFFAADCLAGEAWDPRSLSCDLGFTEKDRAAQLALEIAARIE